MELIQGVREIKLSASEHLKRWEWERIRVEQFKISFKSLSINQYQQSGAFFINEGKNIFITFLVARLVIDGQLTLGAMLAIQYIIGQLNSPIEQLIAFIQSAQDARISLNRLNDIHQVDDEEPLYRSFHFKLPADRTITIKNLSFSYPGADSSPVLNNIDLDIPEGKMTAIVGMSGCGKTSILKLLLRFYDEYQGDIKIGGVPLQALSPRFFRTRCGSVLQDGYIFNDTIARNIAPGDENPDPIRIDHACQISCISTFVDGLPLGLNTKIGLEGNGISAGQKQRILIARAVYKNPDYFFLDESTNSLDAKNEADILLNLRTFLQGKTSIVVAHRLSTIRDADNIIVMDKGRVAESGTHEELIANRHIYFDLIRNQLETSHI